MAHPDGVVSQQSINAFFGRLTLGYAGHKIEVHVLSGEQTIASRILRAANNFGADIKFFDADLDGERGDAAIVDKDGNIYYGDRPDFQSLFNYQEITLLQYTRLMTDSLNFR